MTERERWVVYPLLFLALGVSLRDKLVERAVTNAKNIRCEELVIEDEPTNGEPGRVLARIGRTNSTANKAAIGFIYVNGEVDVDGLVNSQRFAQNGHLFVPILQLAPGVAVPNVIRIPGPGGSGAKAPTPRSPNQPQRPATKPKVQENSAPPSSSIDKKRAATK